MTTYYTIYLENQSAETQEFWCFLAPPQTAPDSPEVYANSSAYLAVPPNSPATNTFTIPVQYVVGAGASNEAVGLNVQINSSVTNDANLQDTWDANYVTVPPQEGPTMANSGVQAPTNSIAIVSNGFDQASNEDQGWFSNQSFGIVTEAGFIGMTWSPNPQQTMTLTPTLKFYVATGDYSSNSLASWDQVSNGSAVVEVPDSFNLNDATVTYTSTGSWIVTPGKPANVQATENLAFVRSPAYAELVALAALDGGDVQQDALVSVSFDSQAQADAGTTYVTGSVTVATALTAAFTYFVLGGVNFSITRPASGVTTFRFSYSGSKSVAAITALFTAGAQLLLGGAQ
jgi:hypothetical protein